MHHLLCPLPFRTKVLWLKDQAPLPAFIHQLLPTESQLCVWSKDRRFDHRLPFTAHLPCPAANKTRTDHATAGTQSQATRPFVTDGELEGISVELNERRSLLRSLTYITKRPVSPLLHGSAQSAPPDLAGSEHRSSPELDPRIPNPRYHVT